MVVSMLALSLPIPNYTRVCRRAQSLGQGIKRLCGNRKITDIVIDSSGLKVFGEGEWHHIFPIQSKELTLTELTTRCRTAKTIVDEKPK